MVYPTLAQSVLSEIKKLSQSSFFSKYLKNDVEPINGTKNLKKLLVFKILAFESGTRNSHNLDQDICHWQSMCYETPRRFNISLREIFSK